MNKKFLNRYTILLNILKNPSFFMKNKQYIFILSHMRSYSTLLSHILANNSDICGYSEKHIPYYTSLDFQILKSKSMERYKGNIQRKFLLDKILGNHCILSEEILRNKSLSIIFLLRNHNDSLKSIIRTALDPTSNIHRFSNENAASDYYINRLTKLKEYSLTSKGKNIFIKSESLMNKTEKTFELLADYLNLEEELYSDYNTFELTGISGYGDHSKYINSGKIVRDRIHTNINISDKISLKCKEAYNECCETLKENSVNYI